MANTIIRAMLPPDSGTVTLQLYAPGSLDLANVGGDTAANAGGGQGYEWTVTEALDGLYLFRFLDESGGEIGSGAVELADDAGPYYPGDPASLVKLILIQEHTDLITSGGITISSPVASDLELTDLYKSTDYTSGTSQPIVFNDDGSWPTLTAGYLILNGIGNLSRLQKAGSLTGASPSQVLTFSLTASDLDLPTGDYQWQLVGVTATGTLVMASSKVLIKRLLYTAP